MVRTRLIWAVIALAIAVPIALAATSPLLAWRSPVYIAAGFAGVLALGLLLVQPLLAGGYLPGLRMHQTRKVHRIVGAVLVAAVVLHVAALWITSPPDVIDVLLFRSPTPFSEWGAIAMWTLFAAAAVAALRRRLKWRPQTWRLAHISLTAVTALCTVMHALLIEGTMETVSKAVLCTLVILAIIKVAGDLRIWGLRPEK